MFVKEIFAHRPISLLEKTFKRRNVVFGIQSTEKSVN